MKASILIISKNRKSDLRFTLTRLNLLINNKEHEVLVLLDGCEDNVETLIEEFSWVNWTFLDKSVGASRARHMLYKQAKGTILVGFDDDAHPLQVDFIEIISDMFKNNPEVGILAFHEIKGVFKSDTEALVTKQKQNLQFLCSEFVGCGFAIKKETYFKTRGFPDWIDIYGEESCVSLEVLANNEQILYTNAVSVNHRVDIIARKKAGHNYFRFEKQLKNTFYYYLVYYKYPIVKLLKLLYHNFKKYALKDFTFFKAYVRAIATIILNLPKILKYRKPVSRSCIALKNSLPSPIFH
ncbi:glycosyltransferase family 2 protein [Bizionia paragorgiae]|uniref:glycosyltransferase family 2 protein n=1 Tax=Bizionia paragorgiae TaxID=283786 RepID=UPI003A926D32